MSYIELLLEDLSEKKKVYEKLEVCGLSTENDKARKRILADSIIHTQSRIIEKLMER